MASSEYANGPPGDLARPEAPLAPPSEFDRRTPDPPFSNDSYQNGGSSGPRTPESGHRLRPTASVGSNAGGSSIGPAVGPPSAPPTNYDSDTARGSNERVRSRNRNGRTPSGQMRLCNKCGEPLTGQFVRALDGTFHLDCFKCQDCGEIVASKFFPVDDESGQGQYPLCETDYFRRLGLLCYQCGGALRGSYITALDRKYHIDHFTCSSCDTVFGAQDSYYEHDGNVYCHYHYSTQFAQRCNGCQIAILKQFVEIFRNGQNQHWHPECYMIHKFWNVRLAQSSEDNASTAITPDDPVGRDYIRQVEERMEEKVFRIWSVLSTFEESSAACISDMLLHVSNGAYLEGVMMAKRFIWHVKILFQSTDKLNTAMLGVNEKGLSYGREAKLLCKKIVSFFSLLSKSQDAGAHKLGLTQELLSLVTGLAHYLKLLIRICLQGALRLEREANASDGLYQFLDDLNGFEAYKSDDNALQSSQASTRLSAKNSDQCVSCNRSIEDECAKSGELRWHLPCVRCTQCKRELGRSLGEALCNSYDGRIHCTECAGGVRDGLMPCEHLSKLGQYIFLLKVALARLLDIFWSNGTLPPPGDQLPPGAGMPTGDGDGESGAPKTHSEAWARSQSAAARDHRRESSYESTLNDVRRLRSTRLDRHLSSSVKQARTSRVMDMDGRGPRPVSVGGEGRDTQDSTDRMFGHNDAITLDDIPRIVAAEQSREQQNVRNSRAQPPGGDPTGAADDGRQRSMSTGRDQGLRSADQMPTSINRKFFSELSALEYFNVRHLAVLTMQPMIIREFTTDELLGFIESKKQVTFWKNLGKAFKNDKNKVNKKKAVFTIPLETIIERDGADSTDGVGPGTLRIPAVVDDIISSMRKMDLSVEGVFRKNGNIKKQQELVDRINTEGCDTVNFMEQPVVQLAALLKRYLRDLPDPLMTHKLFKLWVSAAKIPDLDKRKHCLHLTCCLLPRSHRDCMEVLFSFLKWAGSFHQLDDELGSKMDIRNLATVIAPNILTNPAKASVLDSEAIYVIDAVEVLINNIEEMCQVPDDILALLNDPYIFSSSGDNTTKDIMKRFQERRGHIDITDVSEAYNRQDSSTRPPPRRVDTDPAVWQAESSVRHVQESSFVPSASGQPPPPREATGTPPQQQQQQRWRGPSEPGPLPPGATQYNHSDGNISAATPDQQSQQSQQGQQQRRDWRNSGWGRQGSGLGVGGSS